MQYIILSMKAGDEHSSFSLGCKKRLRVSEAPSLDLSHEVETGGSRWNPTQEQIGILEMVYKRGMRTPNTQQIEQITEQLSKYGRIQGKNVFYWFQNHKARERQKQKRNGGLSLSPTSSLITIDHNNNNKYKETPNKRKCMRWAFEEEQEESTVTTISTSTRTSTSARWWLSCKDNEQHTTLELFPLHPQGR